MPADPRDIYRWQAVYTDGRVLNQYNEDGTKNQYLKLDRVGLSQFRLFRISDGAPVFTVHLDANKRLIWRMRVAKRIMSGVELMRIHLIGWQEKRDGRNFQSINAVFPDGSIETVGRFRENHPWYYGVEFLPGEVD